MFDLNLIQEYAQELQFPIVQHTKSRISLRIYENIIIAFENWERERTIICFDNNPDDWHAHGEDLLDEDITEIELIPLYILDQFKKGELLICIETDPENKKKVSYRFRYYGINALNPGDRVEYIRIN